MKFEFSKSREGITIIILTIVSFAVFGNALFNGFVYDDHFQILDNEWIKDAKYIPKIFSTNVWEFEGEVSNYYRPLMHLSYMACYYIFGIEPFGFHLVNVIFHIGVSLLLFFIILRMLEGITTSYPVSPFPPALAGAVLYAVHPVHTEAVTWVAGIPELSFSFFYLLSFYLYLSATAVKNLSFLLSLLSFFLAILCKETALTLPLIIVCYDFSFRRNKLIFPDLLKRYLIFFMVCGTYLVLRFSVLGNFAPLKRHSNLNVYEYFINIFPLFSKYLKKLFFPVNLNAFHVLHPISSLLTIKGIVSIVIFLLFVISMFISFKKNKEAFFSLNLIALPLIPVLYIPALGENTFSDRYLYLPSAGFVMLLSIMIFWLNAYKAKYFNFILVSFLIIICFYAFNTIERNKIWENDFSLWKDTVKKSPDSAFALNELGIAYTGKGMFDDAIKRYVAALKINPDFARAHNNLGMAYMSMGQIDKAIEHYNEALKISPNFSKAHNNLGIAYEKKGMTDEAIDEFKKTLDLDPDGYEFYINLGNAYNKKRLPQKAMESYQKALELKPGNSDVCMHIGILYGESGQLDNAIEYFEKALASNPSDPIIYFNMSNAYKLKGLVNKAEEYMAKGRSLSER